MIQLTYSYRAGLPVLNKDTNLKNNVIMPIILGNLHESDDIKEAGALAPLVKKFDIKSSATFKNSVKVSSYI